jgi:acyl-CoA thioester hydrolase
MEGVRTMFAQMGLPGLFAPGSPKTVVVREMHIRFHRESRLGTPLSLTGAVTEVESDALAVVLMLTDDGGELKATFRARLVLVRADDPAAALQWPATFLDAAARAVVAVPEAAAARSVGTGRVVSGASLARADELGLARISLGSVGPDRVDAFGRMAPEWFIGGVSDGIRSLTRAYRDVVVRHSPERHERVGGAVLEFRVVHLDWPRVGDSYEVRTGLAGVTDRVKSLVSWMLDPITGRVYGSMQSVAVDFDLDTRRMIRVAPEARAELEGFCIAGLTL